MRHFDVTKFLEEAVAKIPLDIDTVTIPANLKVIRFIDYLTTGMDEDFGHVGTNAGKGANARTRANGRGNLSAHIDICNSCVNSILTKQGARAFAGVTYEDILVPRIPREFEGTDEDVESEWDFMEKCSSVMNNMKGTISLSGNINQTPLLVDKKQINEGTKFYRASLLFGYMNNENAIAVVNGGQAVQVDIKPRYINLDPDMKYIDEDIEKQRPAALKLLAEIFSAKEEDYPDLGVDTANNGTVKNDIRALLNTFKSKVPETGDVFLSSDEIKELIPLLQYFKTPKELRDTNDKFFDKIASGVSALERDGVHFGEYSSRTAEVQDILNAGNYDVVVGYSQAGDTTHTEEFKNKGEEIFVGYATNYPGQNGDEVIPLYIATKNPSEISALKGLMGKEAHVGSVDGGAEIPYKKVNTDKSAKRTGGNELIFQLPSEIYGLMLQPSKAEPAKAKEPVVAPTAKKESAPKGAKTPKEVQPKEPKEVKPKAPRAPKPKVEPVVEPTPEVTPEPAQEPVKAPAEKPKVAEPATKTLSPTAVIFNTYAKQYGEGSIGRAKAITLIREQIKKDTGKSISAESIADSLDKRFPKHSEASSLRSDAETNRPEALNDLFGPDVRDTKLAKSALPRIKAIADGGHKFTKEEIDNLLSRGINQRDLDKILGAVPVMEARIDKGTYSIKALLENINRTKFN